MLTLIKIKLGFYFALLDRDLLAPDLAVVSRLASGWSCWSSLASSQLDLWSLTCRCPVVWGTAEVAVCIDSLTEGRVLTSDMPNRFCPGKSLTEQLEPQVPEAQIAGRLGSGFGLSVTGGPASVDPRFQQKWAPRVLYLTLNSLSQISQPIWPTASTRACSSSAKIRCWPGETIWPRAVRPRLLGWVRPSELRSSQLRQMPPRSLSRLMGSIEMTESYVYLWFYAYDFGWRLSYPLGPRQAPSLGRFQDVVSGRPPAGQLSRPLPLR